MKAFAIAVAVAIGLAIAFGYALDAGWQHRADEAFTHSTSVRGPVHGNTHNLVGTDWSSAREHGWADGRVPTSNAAAPATN